MQINPNEKVLHKFRLDDGTLIQIVAINSIGSGGKPYYYKISELGRPIYRSISDCTGKPSWADENGYSSDNIIVIGKKIDSFEDKEHYSFIESFRENALLKKDKK
jgi:hypothetical protein